MQRYDEFANWYDTYVTSGAGRPIARSADRLLERLLGPVMPSSASISAATSASHTVRLT